MDLGMRVRRKRILIVTYLPLLPPNPTSITPVLPTFLSVLNCILVSTGFTVLPSTMVVWYLPCAKNR